MPVFLTLLYKMTLVIKSSQYYRVTATRLSCNTKYFNHRKESILPELISLSDYFNLFTFKTAQ